MSKPCDLRIIYGPMYSSKTSKLLIELAVHEGLNHSILIINYAKDNRADTGEAQASGILTSHQLTPTRLERSSEIYVERLADVPKSLLDSVDVIGIDESQFFEDIELCVDWVTQLHKLVYAAGLIATSEGTMFGNFYKLIPFGTVKQRVAVCTVCMNKLEKAGITGIRPPATMTLCLSTHKTGDVMIGSSKYIAVCLDHWSEARREGIPKFKETYSEFLQLKSPYPSNESDSD